MEHKLDELQSQGSRLGPANLANHDQLTQLQHEILQLTAENEVSTALLYHVINAEILTLGHGGAIERGSC